MKALGVTLLVAGAISGVVGLWWWALFGMTPDVGTAVLWTAIGSAGGGLALLAAWDLGR